MHLTISTGNSTVEKQMKMMQVLLIYWRRGSEAIKRGVTLVKLKKMTVYQDIVKMKFNIPNDDLKMLDKLSVKLERSLDKLESVYV